MGSQIENNALAIQQAREAADIENHRERVLWLETERPLWACGAPVGAHGRNVLLIQSRAAIAKSVQS